MLARRDRHVRETGPGDTRTDARRRHGGSAMHPMLKPALRRGWRDRDTVQFGVARAHAVVLGPVDTATGSFLDLLDGTRGLPLLREEAGALGLPDRHVDALVERLGAGRAARRRDGRRPGRRRRCADRTTVLDRLRPDLASLSVVHPEPAGGLGRLAARRAVRVQVRGAGRVGAASPRCCPAPASAGSRCVDGGGVEPWDVAPGGLPGRARSASAGTRAARRAGRAGPRAGAGAPRRPRGRRSASGEPGLSLVVARPRDGSRAYAPDPRGRRAAARLRHPASLRRGDRGHGVVGPLVLPGGTACAGCLALPARTGTRLAAAAGPVAVRRGAPRCRPATWRWPRRSPGSPPPTRWPSSTADCPPAPGPGGRLALPRLRLAMRSRSGRIPDCPCGAARAHVRAERTSGSARPDEATMAGVTAGTRRGSLGVGGAHV